jgi:hypothetical protein
MPRRRPVAATTQIAGPYLTEEIALVLEYPVATVRVRQYWSRRTLQHDRRRPSAGELRAFLVPEAGT